MTRSAARTVLQLVLVDETGDSYYRMRWPGAQLAEQRKDWRVINLDAQATERFAWGLEADLLVLIQSGDLDLLPLIEERRRRGKKTLIEYNDQYYEPPAWSPVAGPWSSPLIWQSYELIMNAGDGLTVTGPGLEELFRPLTKKPITQLLNHFPRSLPPFDIINQSPTETFRIGWAGSLGHMADILSIQPVFIQLLEEFPQLRLAFMGNESLPETLHLPLDRVDYTPWGSMEQYLRFWAPIHVGIAPLLDTPYNRCRSDIKAVEMAATATLPVLQRALPYQDFIERTGVPSYDGNRELLETLRALIAAPDKLRTAIGTAYEYIRKERIGRDRTERQALYTALIEGAPESTFKWPLPVGYHEHKGTTDPEAPSTRRLQAIQQLLNVKNYDVALSNLTELARSNPLHPEIQLALFKVLLRLRPSEAKQSILPLRKQFPRDLRFIITQLAFEREEPAWHQHLAELSELLQILPPRAREIFRKDILTVIRGSVARGVLSPSVTETLLRAYPHSPDFQLLHAEQLERHGRHSEAAAVFELLGALFQQAEGFDELRKSASFGFFSAWAEGTRARARKS